jgi:hypothetical protein
MQSDGVCAEILFGGEADVGLRSWGESCTSLRLVAPSDSPRWRGALLVLVLLEQGALIAFRFVLDGSTHRGALKLRE